MLVIMLHSFSHDTRVKLFSFSHPAGRLTYFIFVFLVVKTSKMLCIDKNHVPFTYRNLWFSYNDCFEVNGRYYSCSVIVESLSLRSLFRGRCA